MNLADQKFQLFNTSFRLPYMANRQGAKDASRLGCIIVRQPSHCWASSQFEIIIFHISAIVTPLMDVILKSYEVRNRASYWVAIRLVCVSSLAPRAEIHLAERDYYTKGHQYRFLNGIAKTLEIP
jgi:hypothetical protein